MRNILTILFILISIHVFGQKNKADYVIEMNTRFTLELQTQLSVKNHDRFDKKKKKEKKGRKLYKSFWGFVLALGVRCHHNLS